MKYIKLFNVTIIIKNISNRPPFNASDPMKTYNIILKGIDMIPFPPHVSRWELQFYNGVRILSYIFQLTD